MSYFGSDDGLDELIRAFDIEGYLDGIGKLRKSSRTNVMLVPCPICGDKRRDKFYINVSGDTRHGRWNSYCCHQFGGLISLLAKTEECSRGEAVRYIKSEVDGLDYRITPILPTQPKISSTDEGDLVVDLPGPLVPAEETMGIATNRGVVSFRDRGLNSYIISKYGLKVILMPAYYKGNHRADLANRLFIPIIDETGLMSWQARDLTGQSERKYLFPTGDKSAHTFFGWNYSQDRDCLIITEGVFQKFAFDNLYLDRPNENVAIASFGKKLTDNQIDKLMAALCHTIILAWDLDAAPQIARVAAKLNGRKKVMIMPPSADGRDYDELSRTEIAGLIGQTECYSLALAARMNAELAMRGT